MLKKKKKTNSSDFILDFKNNEGTKHIHVYILEYILFPNNSLICKSLYIFFRSSK